MIYREILQVGDVPYSVESEDVVNMRLVVQDFVENELPKFVEEALENPKVFPVRFMERMAEMGFLGLDIPEEYGGQGMTPTEKIAIFEELAAGDAGLALDVLVQNSLTAFPILIAGTEEQKEKYLTLMAKGFIAAFGLTEPGIGSDARNITLKAEKEDDEYRINGGSKMFITSANGAKIIVLATRTRDRSVEDDGITMFIAEITDEDIKDKRVIIETMDKIGQEGSQLCTVTFDNYILPKEAMLGDEHKGWEQVLEPTLSHSRVWIAAQGSGIALGVLREVEGYMKEREQFGSKLEELPKYLRHVNHLRRQVDLSRLLVKKAAFHEELGDKKFALWASLAKLVAGETAAWAATDGMLLHGGSGYTDDQPISKKYKDAPVIRIYEGTAHIQQAILRKVWKNLKRVIPLFPDSKVMLKDLSRLPTVESLVEYVETWSSEYRNPVVEMFNPKLWRFVAKYPHQYLKMLAQMHLG
jgi:alkylation response protein AidB-like acyl-CoA dehydrogenase